MPPSPGTWWPAQFISVQDRCLSKPQVQGKVVGHGLVAWGRHLARLCGDPRSPARRRRRWVPPQGVAGMGSLQTRPGTRCSGTQPRPGSRPRSPLLTVPSLPAGASQGLMTREVLGLALPGPRARSGSAVGFFRACPSPRSWQSQSGLRTKNNSPNREEQPHLAPRASGAWPAASSWQSRVPRPLPPTLPEPGLQAAGLCGTPFVATGARSRGCRDQEAQAPGASVASRPWRTGWAGPGGDWSLPPRRSGSESSAWIASVLARHVWLQPTHPQHPAPPRGPLP